jgi:nucleoid DNA-binding protein
MNNQLGLSENFQNKGTAIDTLDIVIVNALLEGKNVVIPDFGYLELKLFPDNRRTVLFKVANPQELPRQISLDGLEGEDHFSILLNCISKPLKEGKVVSMPSLGIFRPLRQGDGNFHVSFTPSSTLRKCLKEERKFEANVQTKKDLLSVNLPELPVNEAIEKEFSQNEAEITPKLQLMIEKPERDDHSTESYKSRLFSKLTTILKRKTDNIEKNNIENKNKKELGATHSSDEIVEGKTKNIAGYLLVSVFSIALVVVVITIFFQKKADIPPLESGQGRSHNLVDAARKNYGNPIFWVYIYESNQDKLTSPVNIPDNVVLTIPDLSEYNIDITDTLEVIRARIRAENILQKYIEKNK